MTLATHGGPGVGRRASAMALCLAGVLGGCATLRSEAPADAEPKPAPQVQLTIVAPSKLKSLLETHLDLSRLAVVAPGEALSESELRRLEAATPAQARSLLATEGFMDPEVTVVREVSAAGATPRLRVQVAPGAQSQVEHIDLNVQGELAEAAERGDADAQATLAAWRKAWRLGAGNAFTAATWRDAKSGALARLHAGGYLGATWRTTSAQVDADSSRVRLVAVADSGPLFRTGALAIEGLERQDERSVRNLADFAPGAPATEALLLDLQERLQQANLFDRISVTLDPDPAAAAAATVHIRVRELPLQQATAGIGISANTGPRVSIEHLHRRAFGERAILRNKLELGRLRQAWEGELSSHIQPGLYRDLIGGAAERLESDSDRVSSLRMRLGRAYDSPKVDRLWFIEAERALTRPLIAPTTPPVGDVATTAATLNFHGTWRNVDNIVLPTAGRSLALQSGVGQVRSNNGSGPFTRLHGRIQTWQPLGGSWHGQARIEVGQVFARGDVNVPESQRFRAGGDGSVRGYAYRSLTPQVGGVDVGGKVLLTASAEVAHPVSARWPNVWWAAFIDAGRAAESWDDWSAAWGAGVGLRIRSPVGPLRLDIAYGEEAKQFRLHLSVGVVF